MLQINEDVKLVCIVRKDLLPGQQIAQTAHAVADYATEYPEDFAKWHANSNTLVCLQANDETHLTELLEKLRELKHPTTAFREPDFQDSLTAISFVAERDLRKKFSSLSLAGKVINAKS